MWYNTLFIFLCWTYFTEHNALLIYPFSWKWQNFFFFFHCFFSWPLFYSSVDGCLGCFHIWQLWTVLLRTLGCMYFFELAFSFFFRYITRSRIAGSYGSSTLVFWEASILFSTMSEPVYILGNYVRFPFSPHPHQSLLFCIVSWSSCKRSYFCLWIVIYMLYIT